MGLRIAGTKFAERTARNMAVAAQAVPIPPQGDVNPDLSIPRNRTHAYIYALIDPRTNEVRYIGKTFHVKGRYLGHCKGKGPTRSANWIRSLARQGLKPTVEIVEIINSTVAADWEAAERQWVANFKLLGYKLTNLTDGGDSGWSLTEDARQRISKAQKGRKKPAHVGAAVAAANRNRSQEWRDKKAIQASNISEETRSKMRASAFAMSEEKRKAISETVKKHWANGVYKPHSKESYERAAAKMRGQKRTPEQIENIRRGALNRKRKEATA